jgi:6-phosphofructokinase 1
MTKLKHSDLQIKQLGRCTVKSPIILSHTHGDGIYDYVNDGDRILYNSSLESYNHCHQSGEEPLSFEKAGPREHIYFEPAKTKVGIVTCGGLCPGLNNVIRSLVYQFHNRYGVKSIVGFQYGYEGLIPEYNHPVIELTPEVVEYIYLSGGSILGSSRGNQDVGLIVDTLERMNINILFCIGGDGTLRGAQAIHEEIEKRGLKISIAGIPKTIDNDINFLDKTFGFETAFTVAKDIILNAHNEAHGAFNGIALIKLMGRDSGFIAASAVLSAQEVNFVLVPEMEFDLYGEKGFLNILKERLKKRHHALIVVAEGAGQFFFDDKNVKHDASGNVKYKDIGLFLRDKITEEFEKDGFPFNLRYIDPSYIIRSAPANANDSKFCHLLAQNAGHAAMAGKTNFVVGNWGGSFTLLPISAAVAERKHIDLEGELWYNVLEATAQPACMKNTCL